jgi:hypothetical protein
VRERKRERKKERERKEGVQGEGVQGEGANKLRGEEEEESSTLIANSPLTGHSNIGAAPVVPGVWHGLFHIPREVLDW